MKRTPMPIAIHRRVLSGACGLALALLAASVIAAPPAVEGATAGATPHGIQAFTAPNRVEPAAQPNQPAVQIVEPPESGERADAFRVRVVLNPQLIDRRIYRSASVQTFPQLDRQQPGVYSSYTEVSIDDVLKGVRVDVGKYRGPIRVYVSISRQEAYTPGETLFIAERLSKVTEPVGPVGLEAIRTQDARASWGTPSNTPRVAPVPAQATGQLPRSSLQPPPSAFGTRP